MSSLLALDQIVNIVSEAKQVVIIQADNPDGDSLGSALALEHILGDMGKTVNLYCGVDIPGYLHYLSGWDRVSKELPTQFDASIIVDASTTTLLEKIAASPQQAWLASKPCLVLDHHANVDNPIPFATVVLNDAGKSSTGELIYDLAKQAGWELSLAAQENIMTCILGDTQGLSNQLATPTTYRIMAELIEAGVNRPELEEMRREYNKMPPDIYRYKADLIKKTEFDDRGEIAWVSIGQQEINTFSPLYNPAPLIQGDMLQTIGVRLAIVFKTYSDGRVTAAIRCNPGAPVGGRLASKMGGGGHDFAAGFKDQTGRPYSQIKTECLACARQLLNELEKEPEL